MKKLLLLIFVILTFNLYSCNNIYSNQGSDKIYKITDRYSFVKNNGLDQMITLKDSADTSKVIINSTVVEFGFDLNYLLAKQVPRNTSNSNDDSGATESEMLSYWIIDMNTDKLYGPYNTIEKLNEAKTLYDIPSNIQLKSQKEYK